jgi:hypothetical protein
MNGLEPDLFNYFHSFNRYVAGPGLPLWSRIGATPKT